MKLLTREYAVAVAKRTEKGIYDIKNTVFQIIRNSMTFWAADPFPIEVNGELYIFAEIFEYSKNKGSIGYTKLEKENFTPWKIVIEVDYHLSFPNLISIDGILYLCPESYQSGKVYLYRCTDFPCKWVKDKILIDNGKYVDTVFYRSEGETYGITGCLEKSCPEFPRFSLFKLTKDGCVFSNGSLNTLERSMTRSAGKIIKDTLSGKEIIVSQICKPLYGSGLVFKNFNLNWPDYYESELFRVLPSDILCDKKRDFVGVHTFNLSEHYMVIDLIWNRFSVFERIQSLKRKVRGIF